MSFKSIMINLYYILIHSDGKVSEKEVLLGKQMAKAEGISQPEFDAQIKILESQEVNSIYKNTVFHLKTLDRKQQVKTIAWLCLIANSDGFMDREEWKFIYKLYCTELKLSLDEILSVQRDLTKVKPNFTAYVPDSLFTTVL